MDTYEKKYKEAQSWIEKIYPTLQHEQQMEAEAFFPELKESEDERIRKDIIDYFQSDWAKEEGITRPDWIAWLEKQGEQKVNYTTLVETGNGEINALVTGEVSNNDYEEKPADKVGHTVVRDFNSVFSREQVEEIDKRIEKSQKLYNAKLRDAMRKVEDFPMTD